MPNQISEHYKIIIHYKSQSDRRDGRHTVVGGDDSNRIFHTTSHIVTDINEIYEEDR